MVSALAHLHQAISLLESAVSESPDQLDDEQLCAVVRAVERAGRLVDSLRISSAAEIDDRSRFEFGPSGLSYRLGHRRGVHLIEHLTRVSQAEATRRASLGRAVRSRRALDGRPIPPEFPATAASLADGDLPRESAAVIVACLRQATTHGADPALVRDAESQLIAEAQHTPADGVAIMARAWREALDPDGAEPRDADLRSRRELVIGRERGGMTPISGSLDPVSAGLLRAAFAESTAPDAQPRFLSEEDAPVVDGDLVLRVHDPRNRGQRQLDVLVGLVTAGMRSTGQRSTATVVAVIRQDDLETGRGVGWIDDVAEPVSAETVRELACDAGVITMVLGSAGEVLAEGRRERYFTPAQRRALAVRDGGCVWPQCTAPPSWCHAHHVEEWSRGGPTDVDNGALLCPAHHHMLHNSEFTLRMVDGRPRLLAPPWLDPQREWKLVGRSRLAWFTAA